MSDNQDRRQAKGKGPAYQNPDAGPSTLTSSTSSQQPRSVESSRQYDADMGAIERMMTEAADAGGASRSAAIPDPWTGQALPTQSRSSSFESTVPDTELSSSEDSDASSKGSKAKPGKDARTSIDRFREWQNTHPHSSVASAQLATASELIQAFREYRENQRKSKATPLSIEPGKPNLYELLMTLPPELQLLVFDNLGAAEILTVSLSCKNVQSLVEALLPSIMTSRPQIQTFKRSLDRFDYKDQPFVKVLQHWNMKKGIDLTNPSLNGLTFAQFYMLQNSDADPESILEHPKKHIGHYAEFALLLTHLHLATHKPDKDLLVGQGYGFLKDPAYYEDEIRKLSHFRPEAKISKESAIKKVKDNKSFLSGNIWTKDMSIFYSPEGTPLAAKGGRLHHLNPLTPMHVGGSVNEAGNDLNLIPRALGLPLLPYHFDGDQSFAYCWRSPEDRSHFSVPIHNLKMANIKGGALANVFKEPHPLLKAHIMEHLMLY